MSDSSDTVDDWLKGIVERIQAERKGGAAPTPETITVRRFIQRFGKARRGYRVVAEVRQKLEAHHLRTSPDFEFEYIDNRISIVLDDDVGAKDIEKKNPTVRVGSLTAAHKDLARVTPNDTVVRATTMMRMQDFSQLPVMTRERDVKGVISWRSIGMAYANKHTPTEVRECMEEAHVINTKTTLTEASQTIWKHGYVLVRDEKSTITGIVTSADLADQFRQLAQPFLLVGEIEHHLRNFMRGRFTLKELKKASDGKKDIKGLDDLTFGNYCRLLQGKESWEKLELNIDHKEFNAVLEQVRNIRNDVMHFSPDGIEPEDLNQLESLAGLFRQLVHT